MVMDFTKMSKEDAIKTVFRQSGLVPGGGQFASTFVRDLRNARELARRDSETGAKEPRGPYSSFKGAMLYLDILALLGRTVVPKKARAQEGDSVLRALDCFLPGTSFESLGLGERTALSALRKSYGHGTSLIYRSPEDPKKGLRFVLIQRGDAVATLPKEPWDGDAENDSLAVCTQVNLERLGDLVEEMTAAVRDMAEKEELWCVLKGGATALLGQMSNLDDSIDTRWRVTE